MPFSREINIVLLNEYNKNCKYLVSRNYVDEDEITEIYYVDDMETALFKYDEFTRIDYLNSQITIWKIDTSKEKDDFEDLSYEDFEEAEKVDDARVSEILLRFEENHLAINVVDLFVLGAHPLDLNADRDNSELLITFAIQTSREAYLSIIQDTLEKELGYPVAMDVYEYKRGLDALREFFSISTEWIDNLGNLIYRG
jgi:hypothetical protein